MDISKKNNSINSQSAQQLRNQQSVIELLTKLDQSLNSNESYVTAQTYDSNGNLITTQIPTVGFFQQKLDQIYKMVKTLSGLEGSNATMQVANNTFKRIITADLNNEPKTISQLSPVSTFKADPNWIFDTFLNPKISVELDLTDKINPSTKNILSKRFIVEFDKEITTDNDGNQITQLTSDAKLRVAEFNSKYKGKSNIDITEFVVWLDSAGVTNAVNPNLISENYYRLQPNLLQYKGSFDVLSTEIDTINKKMWYVLNSLTYYDISDTTVVAKPVDLKIGDTITINPNQDGIVSATVYKVVEISTVTNQYRVRFERLFGEEPIPVRLSAISIYSQTVAKKSVKINVGFDEYSVIFVKQVDENSNITSHDWSSGIGFYTNELRLDGETGQLFSDYYISQVYDYGLVLEDLVAKRVPTIYAEKPSAPVLDVTNFKVVQINSHLTQTVEAEKIRDLHNQKNNIASEITQIQSQIEKQNRLISKTNFTSSADKKRATDQLATLNAKLNTRTQSKVSIVNDILASKKNLNKISPVYHARGFFPMPSAVTSTQTKPQEVVQFEIWYRKISKSGNENPILTINDIDNIAAQKSNSSNTTTQNVFRNKTINGSFSNWNKYKTDARKRVQDPITNQWKWEIEDVSDASTPNINQLDLAILPGEIVEVKIKSLSEVGWPETPKESDFSNTIQIVFPDELNNVLSEDEFILKEAQADDIKVSFNKDLETMGLNLHLQSALRDVDVYYAHKSNAIASGFKDANGKEINLYDYLLSLVSKVNTLEETITKAKGILEVYLINRTNQTRIYNGSNQTFNINLEDYMTQTKIGLISNPVDSIARTYKNEVLLINDYSLMIKNSAQSANLGLLSYRGYGKPSGLQSAEFAYDGKAPNLSVDLATITDRAIQATWVQSDSTVPTASLSNSGVGYLYAPNFATQKNNQWIWLQLKSLEGDYIYNGTDQQPSQNTWTQPNSFQNASMVHDILTTENYNAGLYNNGGGAVSGDNITQITENNNWEINEDPTASTAIGKMASTIHPVTKDLDSITDVSSQLIKYIKPGDTEALIIPINIYAKPFTGTGVSNSTATPDTKFIDDDYISGAGTMPEVNLATTNISRNSNGNMEILLTAASDDNIVAGDRLVISGFTNSNTTSANNNILTIVAVNTTTHIIQVNYKLPSGFASITEAAVVIDQLHKKYIDRNINAYNVLGTVGSDERFVKNYIEIISTTNPNPRIHTKKLHFLFEDENNIRPFDIQLTWNIKQYKPITIAPSYDRRITL